MISVIIVNWCSGEWLRKCLKGLAIQTLAPDRIIIIDNASRDHSLTGIEEILPVAEIIKEKENHGFAKANNIGIGMLEEEGWTVLLNPDAIPEPEWLEKLIEATIKFPQYGFFSCKMLCAESPEYLDGAGGDNYHTCGLVWRNGHGKSVNEITDSYRECFSPCAAAALYKTKILKEVGGFDESFFCYIEDVDLGFRLRLAGYRCLYVPDAAVRHGGSVSTGKKSDFSVYYGHRNIVWTYVKNMPGMLFWVYLPQHFLLNIFTIIFLTIRGQGKIALRAKYDAFVGLYRCWKERKKVQMNRKVSILEIRKFLNKGLTLLKR